MITVASVILVMFRAGRGYRGNVRVSCQLSEFPWKNSAGSNFYPNFIDYPTSRKASKWSIFFLTWASCHIQIYRTLSFKGGRWIASSQLAISFPGGSVAKNMPANVRGAFSIPGSGRCPGRGTGNPLQYSCLENSTERGAWQATVHVITKSRTQLTEYIHRNHIQSLSCPAFLIFNLFFFIF